MSLSRRDYGEGWRTKEDSSRNRHYKKRTRSCSFSLFLSLPLSLVFVPSRFELGLTARDKRVASIFTATTRVMSTDRITETSRAESRPDIPFVTQHRSTCVTFVNCKRCLSLTTRNLSSSCDRYTAHIKKLHLLKN